MTEDNRKNIKVPPELHGRLEKHMNEYETWPAYLNRLLIAAGGPVADTGSDRAVEE